MKKDKLSKMKSLFVASVILMITVETTNAASLSDEARSEIVNHIDSLSGKINQIAREIWLHPELGYKEVETSKLLSEELGRNGFKVTNGVAGIPTAFVASYGSNDGPVIAIMAEMDALPGFSQDATATVTAIKDQSNGHACGHNLFGAGSVGAAIAVSKWMEANSVKGQVRVYGTPAEEGGSGKVHMVRAGLFNDVDITLHWHPGASNGAWQDKSLANISGKFKFHGVSAHAGIAPEKGRSALDGVEAMNHMVNMMREHVPEKTRIHYVITNGGKAPNVVPDFAESYLYIRHPDPSTVLEIFERITKAAEGAALGTGTTVDIERIGGVYSLLPNDTLGRVMDENLRAARPIKWTPEEMNFAEKLQESMTKKPDLAKAFAIEEYEFGFQGSYSTDVGDVSWATPTASIGTASWVPGTSAHSWQAVAASGMTIGEKGMLLAEETLASTAATLFLSPDLVARAKAEFEKARGKDFHYVALTGDQAPPLTYRDEPMSE
ncbi:amidohydrolase [Brucella endophytica]|uniref:Amidohydrolase n=1 Tax=Brucella endophytica TaxID=1963359 RepID=A0A916SQ24_9HYPH|nr:amidohydrolase [Brucella endophytica]GGB10854.1 amidohydrolase [Brucella endophytica]